MTTLILTASLILTVALIALKVKLFLARPVTSLMVALTCGTCGVPALAGLLAVWAIDQLFEMRASAREVA